MRFAKRVFLTAAVYGVIALIPQYFRPAPAERPEFFYGFIGIALAWQAVFFLISRDPARYRALMPVGVLEKAAFGIPALLLYFQGRLATDMLAAGIIDLVLGSLFVIAWHRTRADFGVLP